MKKLLLAVALTVMAVPNAGCNDVGRVATEVAKTPITLAHARLAQLTLKVGQARESGKLVPGTPAAKRVAQALRDAATALEQNNLSAANEAMDRADKEVL